MAANHAKLAIRHLTFDNNGRQLSPIVKQRAPLLFVAVLAVIIPHLVSLEQLPKDACAFLSFTGIPCPFCGLTRSLWAAAEGRWLWSFTFAPLGGIVYLGALLFLVAVAVETLIGKRIIPAFGNRMMGWAVFGVLLLNWAVHLTTNWI